MCAPRKTPCGWCGCCRTGCRTCPRRRPGGAPGSTPLSASTGPLCWGKGGTRICGRAVGSAIKEREKARGGGCRARAPVSLACRGRGAWLRVRQPPAAMRTAQGTRLRGRHAHPPPWLSKMLHATSCTEPRRHTAFGPAGTSVASNPRRTNGGVTAPLRMCRVREGDVHDPGDAPPPARPHALATGACPGLRHLRAARRAGSPEEKPGDDWLSTQDGGDDGKAKRRKLLARSGPCCTRRAHGAGESKQGKRGSHGLRRVQSPPCAVSR